MPRSRASPLPGVQPVTVVALCAGVALGARAGIGVGALAALASNFVLGQGIWTPWQMLGWGLCGAVGGAAAPLLQRRLPLAVTACVLGFAFSALMDLWLWFSFYPHTWPAFAATMARGLPFDVAHAAGNFALALLIGPELRRVLDRSAARLRTEIVWESVVPPGRLWGHPAPPPASSVEPGDARGVRGP